MPAVACRPSPVHGRGLFVRRAVRAGGLLDRGPVLVVEHDTIAESALACYVFEFDDTHSALALGLTSMVNHSTSPNAEVAIDPDTAEYEMRALCDLPAGTEVLIDYGYRP